MRVDQPRNATAAQIALAVRDEVRDLVTVGPLSKLTSLPSRSPYPSSERYVQDKRRKERKEKKERKEERRRRKSRKNLVLSCLFMLSLQMGRVPRLGIEVLRAGYEWNR